MEVLSTMNNKTDGVVVRREGVFHLFYHVRIVKESTLVGHDLDEFLSRRLSCLVQKSAKSSAS